MKRMYNSHIIIPKSAGPPTLAPLMENRQSGVVAVTMRIAAASRTGPPSSSARNTDRRDQSICPSDSSKMRIDDAISEGAARRPGTAGGAGDRGRPIVHRRRVTVRGHVFTRYWNTACRLSSGEVTSWMVPSSPLAANTVSRA